MGAPLIQDCHLLGEANCKTRSTAVAAARSIPTRRHGRMVLRSFFHEHESERFCPHARTVRGILIAEDAPETNWSPFPLGGLTANVGIGLAGYLAWGLMSVCASPV